MEIELQLGGMCLEDVQKRLLDGKYKRKGGEKENRGQKEIDGDDGAQTASDVPWRRAIRSSRHHEIRTHLDATDSRIPPRDKRVAPSTWKNK